MAISRAGMNAIPNSIALQQLRNKTAEVKKTEIKQNAAAAANKDLTKDGNKTASNPGLAAKKAEIKKDPAKYTTYTFMAFGTFLRPNGITLASSGIGQNMNTAAPNNQSSLSKPMVKRTEIKKEKTDQEKREEIFWTSSTLVPTFNSKLKIYNQNNATIENTNKQYKNLAALAGYSAMTKALSHIK